MAERILILTNLIKDKGGWLADNQFFIQNNSIPLLAHGLGKPVDDARTSFDVKGSASYHIWVRTRDWTKRWSKDGSAGLFNVLIDGESIGTFGNEKLDASQRFEALDQATERFRAAVKAGNTAGFGVLVGRMPCH